MIPYGADYTDEYGEPLQDGADLLDRVRSALIRYVIFPSPQAADAVTLWIAATHAQSAFEHATRCVVKSPIKRCGKTRLQETASELVHQPLRTTNISTAALVRSIDEHDPPTLILDEADAIFATRRGERSEGAEDLRGILNSGHSRGWPYIRWDAVGRRREECPTFAMALIGGIGDMPDTIEDRAVVISMRRRGPNEQVSPFRRRRAIPALRELRDSLHEWVRSRADDLGKAEPDLPVEDREADVWESLVAVADAAGGEWPARARQACLVLTGETDVDEATAGERLLADLQRVFGAAERLYGSTVLDRLHAIEEAPWGDWYGKPLSPRDLTKLLKPYRIASKNVREGGTGPVRKGYVREDLADAWARYVRNTATGGESTQEERVAGRVAPSHGSPATEADQPFLTAVADVADVAVVRPSADRPSAITEETS